MAALSNNRRAPRKALVRDGILVAGRGQREISCTIADISAGGAGIKLADSTARVCCDYRMASAACAGPQIRLGFRPRKIGIERARFPEPNLDRTRWPLDGLCNLTRVIFGNGPRGGEF